MRTSQNPSLGLQCYVLGPGLGPSPSLREENGPGAGFTSSCGGSHGICYLRDHPMNEGAEFLNGSSIIYFYAISDGN